jgi:hypothetical protein
LLLIAVVLPGAACTRDAYVAVAKLKPLDGYNGGRAQVIAVDGSRLHFEHEADLEVPVDPSRTLRGRFHDIDITRDGVFRGVTVRGEVLMGVLDTGRLAQASTLDRPRTILLSVLGTLVWSALTYGTGTVVVLLGTAGE